LFSIPFNSHELLVIKAITLQAWTGPEGFRRLRLPDFKTIGTCRWLGCQTYAPATFTPQEIIAYYVHKTVILVGENDLHCLV
jgi:hypothetical protein